jgi:hypothetical protein
MKALFSSVLLLAACSPFDPDLGGAPYKCSVATDGARCPEGYTCMEGDPSDPTTHVCVNGDDIPDAGNIGFQCLQDTFGENDTIQGAFVTPVAAQNQMFAALTSLCPEADKDNYGINITSTATIQVSSSWESGMPVNVSVLNAGGTSIGNGAPKGANQNCVCLKDLPMGQYYASVFAGASVQNNYRVEIKVVSTADCLAPPACNP